MKIDGESPHFFDGISKILSINFIISMVKMLINPANNELNMNYFKKWDEFEVMFYVMRIIGKLFPFSF
jgi:hypothetical protein